MKIAVISDLHVGRPSSSCDRFGHDEASFAAFLDELERSFEQIILLGDVWDALMPVLPWTWEREYWQVRASRPALRARFSTPPYVCVAGNHDMMTTWLEGAPEERLVEYDGLRILFTHGHQHDFLVRRALPLTRLGSWTGGWLRRLRLKALLERIERAENIVRGASGRPDTDGFQRWAVGLARQRDVGVIVTAHTHLGLVAQHGDVTFCNCGSCSDGQLQYLAIDTARREFTFHP